MSHTPFLYMQRAVDIVTGSPHPSNKIAATLTGLDQNGREFAISRTNYWPEEIERKLGHTTKIGNSSGTLHAETACILEAPKTKNAKAFITDPPCPNCAKNLAEAGICEVYIDHKGFDKDFARRRGGDFENMALRIFENAGIKVFKLWRKEERLEPIGDIPESYVPPLENPVHERITRPERFNQIIDRAHRKLGDTPFAIGLAYDPEGLCHALSTSPHPVIGYTSKTATNDDDKYTYILEPINRMLMTAARKGLKLDPEYVYTSRTPTSRELVNMIGAGLTQISIGDPTKARDEHGLQALGQLKECGILSVKQSV